MQANYFFIRIFPTQTITLETIFFWRQEITQQICQVFGKSTLDKETTPKFQIAYISRLQGFLLYFHRKQTPKLDKKELRRQKDSDMFPFSSEKGFFFQPGNDQFIPLTQLPQMTLPKYLDLTHPAFKPLTNAIPNITLFPLYGLENYDHCIIPSHLEQITISPIPLLIPCESELNQSREILISFDLTNVSDAHLYELKNLGSAYTSQIASWWGKNYEFQFKLLSEIEQTPEILKRIYTCRISVSRARQRAVYESLLQKRPSSLSDLNLYSCCDAKIQSPLPQKKVKYSISDEDLAKWQNFSTTIKSANFKLQVNCLNSASTTIDNLFDELQICKAELNRVNREKVALERQRYFSQLAHQQSKKQLENLILLLRKRLSSPPGHQNGLHEYKSTSSLDDQVKSWFEVTSNLLQTLQKEIDILQDQISRKESANKTLTTDNELRDKKLSEFTALQSELHEKTLNLKEKETKLQSLQEDLHKKETQIRDLEMEIKLTQDKLTNSRLAHESYQVIIDQLQQEIDEKEVLEKKLQCTQENLKSTMNRKQQSHQRLVSKQCEKHLTKTQEQKLLFHEKLMIRKQALESLLREKDFHIKHHFDAYQFASNGISTFKEVLKKKKGYYSVMRIGNLENNKDCFKASKIDFEHVAIENELFSFNHVSENETNAELFEGLITIMLMCCIKHKKSLNLFCFGVSGSEKYKTLFEHNGLIPLLLKSLGQRKLSVSSYEIDFQGHTTDFLDKVAETDDKEILSKIKNAFDSRTRTESLLDCKSSSFHWLTKISVLDKEENSVEQLFTIWDFPDLETANMEIHESISLLFQTIQGKISPSTNCSLSPLLQNLVGSDKFNMAFYCLRRLKECLSPIQKTLTAMGHVGFSAT